MEDEEKDRACVRRRGPRAAFGAERASRPSRDIPVTSVTPEESGVHLVSAQLNSCYLCIHQSDSTPWYVRRVSFIDTLSDFFSVNIVM